MTNSLLSNKLVTCLLCVSALAIHCTPKESTRMRAVPDGNFEVSQETSDVNAQSSLAAELTQLLLAANTIVSAEVGKADYQIDSVRLMDTFIRPQKGRLINPDFLLNPNVRYLETPTGEEIIPSLVALYNQAVILTHRSNPDLLSNEGILDAYKFALNWDCSDSLRDGSSCAMLTFYRWVDRGHITAILRLISEAESDAAQRLRWLRIGFEIKNNRLDPELRFMMLSRLVDNIQRQGSGGMSDYERIQEANFFANTLRLTPVEAFTVANSEEIFARLDWLELSRSRTGSYTEAMSDIIRLAGSQLIYSGENLSSILADAINRRKYVVGPLYEQGVLFQRDNLMGLWQQRSDEADTSSCTQRSLVKADPAGDLRDAEHNLTAVLDSAISNDTTEIYAPNACGVVDNLLSNVEFTFDEYFFLVHQLFYGHFNLDDAVAFWGQTKQNEERLLEATMNVIRLQFVNSTLMTNTIMNRFYATAADTSSIIELLRDSDREASKVRKAWTKLITRSQFLSTFANRMVQSSDTTVRASLEQLRSTAQAIPKNIKFMVTYPNMYPLLHLLASEEMEETFRTFFGPVTIKSDDLIQVFFGGRFTPWFNFGHDGNKLDANEIIYSYHYALTTGVFDTYKSLFRSEELFSQEFFRVVVKKLIQSIENEIDDQRNDIIDKRDVTSSTQARLLSVCNEERFRQQRESNAYEERLAGLEAEVAEAMEQGLRPPTVLDALADSIQSRRQTENQVPFTSVHNQVYDYNTNLANKPGKLMDRIFTNGYVTALQSIRSGDALRYSKANIMRSVHKAYTNEDNIDQVFAEVFQNYNIKKIEFTKQLLEFTDSVDICDDLLIQRNRDIRFTLINKEIHYLEGLFDKVWDVVYTELDENQREYVINGRNDQWSDTFFQTIQESADTLLATRLGEIRQEVSPYTQDSDFYPTSFVNSWGLMELSSSSALIYKGDYHARIKSYLESAPFEGQYNITPPTNFSNNAVLQKVNPQTIDFDWSITSKERAKENFVSAGILAFSNVALWAKSSPHVAPFKKKGDLLVELYKHGHVAINTEIFSLRLTEDATVDPTVLQSTSLSQLCAAIQDSPESFEVPATNDTAASTPDYGDYCRKVTAGEVLDHYATVLKLHSIDELDEFVMPMIGKANDNKYQDSILEQYIKRDDVDELYSLYDLVFKRVFSDSSVTSAESVWFQQPLMDYVTTHFKVAGSTFIFPYPESIERAFLNEYEPWIVNYFNSVSEFVEEILTRSQERTEDVQSYVYRYNLQDSFTVGVSEDDSNRQAFRNVLSRLMTDKFYGMAENLNNDTSLYFDDFINGNVQQIRAQIRDGLSED